MTAITVFPPSRSGPPKFDGLALQQDNWNDYSFQTQYHLYVATSEFTGLIGAVKVLKQGQTTGDPLQLKTGPLEPLGEEFISLGQDLDYYERLASLSAGLRMEILGSLRDALAYPDRLESFETEPGWKTSVLRYIDWESFRRDAAVLLERDYDRVARLGLALSFQVNGWANPAVFKFEAPSDPLFGPPTAGLPDRIAVLVGRNGSGKSTLLYRLARILHASQKDRLSAELRRLGEITPPGIGFTRVLNLAYSAFDEFQLPGLNHRERMQIADDLERGTGRYRYCGLRDVVWEIRRAEGVGDVDGRPIQPDGLDRQELAILKTSEQLAAEFGRTISQILESGRGDLFSLVCRTLASDSSFIDFGPDPAESIGADPIAHFRRCSTGHKIALHAAASLVAYTEAKTIVLIDEPESHLHPPLLAALMHSIRIILRKHDAFAIIATHSPVVAQETLSRHISVVRRAGSETHILSPRIETYGESIGEITNEVFGLNADATDFHQTLGELVQAGLSLESIEGMFDRGLSLQARAFVMTLIAGR